MEVHHSLKLKIEPAQTLWALGMVLVAGLLALGIVLSLTPRTGAGQAPVSGALEVAARIGPGHGLDDAQQGGVEPAGRRVDRVAGGARRGSHD